jgi:hypothetical protein
VQAVQLMHPAASCDGHVLQDLDLNRRPLRTTVASSNAGTSGSTTVEHIADARFFGDGAPTGQATTAALAIGPEPMEVQILIPTELAELAERAAQRAGVNVNRGQGVRGPSALSLQIRRSG